MDQNLLYNIALAKIPNIGPVKAKLLISYCGNAEAVFKANKKELLKIPQIGIKFAERILNAATLDSAAAEIEYLDSIGGRAIPFHSPDYPQRLKHFDTSPLVLYHNGTSDLNHPRTVAIIGTRLPTELGKMNCEKLVKGLKEYGVQVISGLAFGVDTVAHKTAVEEGMETIGIMGHGLDSMSPAENKGLSRRMMQNGGLLTEFPKGTIGSPENFPMRNRIIASMSDVVVVVESKRKGGSIITAEFANSYNKDVFAIPGRINDETSEGCNKLIKQHKAHLLESAADVSYIMRWEEMSKAKVIQPKLFVDLDEREQSVVDAIKEKESITIDELSHKLNIQSSEMSSILLQLEFKGVVRTLPGKTYILT